MPTSLLRLMTRLAILCVVLLVSACRGVPCTAGESCRCQNGTCQLECIGSGQGCSFRCSPGLSCNFYCPGGGCTITCDRGSVCAVDCPGGGCKTDCQNAASCIVDCTGQGCDLACTGAATCKISGCTRDCDLTCGGAPRCESSCTGASGCSTT